MSFFGTIVHPVSPCLSFLYLSADGLSERGSTAIDSARSSSVRSSTPAWCCCKSSSYGSSSEYVYGAIPSISRRSTHLTSGGGGGKADAGKRAGWGATAQSTGTRSQWYGAHRNRAAAPRGRSTPRAGGPGPAVQGAPSSCAPPVLACAPAITSPGTGAPPVARKRSRA
eukprot:scaffold8631_cov108-Isochrysis_galbana.AAC.6